MTCGSAVLSPEFRPRRTGSVATIRGPGVARCNRTFFRRWRRSKLSRPSNGGETCNGIAVDWVAILPPAQPAWLTQLPEITSRLTIVPKGRFFSLLPIFAVGQLVELAIVA